MSRLIIVCGLPGSGKTTLAQALSKELSIACLHKDSIKETLYESLGFSTLSDSRVLGPHSIKLLFELAEDQLKNGVDVIIEAPFTFEEDFELFRTWEKNFQVKIYSIVCHIEKEVRDKRFVERERHQAHHDVDRLIENDGYSMPNSDAVYERLPGKIIHVHTDMPPEELVMKLLKELK